MNRHITHHQIYSVISGIKISWEGGQWGRIYLEDSLWSCVLSHFSCVWLCATPWTVVHQAPLSMGFSRQEYCSGFPFPSPGDLPNPGVEPGSPALQVDSLPSEPQGKPLKLTEIPLSNKKKWTTCSWSVSECYILYNSISMTSSKSQSYRDGEEMSGGQD